MILICNNCNETFVASLNQRERYRAGKTIFTCSLSCRGQLGAEALTQAKGFGRSSQKVLARSRVRGALSRGDIAKPKNCEGCGKSTPLQAHHYAGYEKHLVVKWLCVPCHATEDAHTKKRGTEHSLAKLNDDKVRVIRNRLSSGASLISIASEFGVSKKTILNIKQARIWRHVS